MHRPSVTAPARRAPLLALCCAGLALSGCAGDPGTAGADCPGPAAAPARLAGPERRAPVVATAPGGWAVAAWESVTGRPVQAALRRPDGTWGAPADLSEAAAQTPQAGVDARGDAVVAWDGHDAEGRAVARVAESRDGRWVPARDLGAPGGVAPRDPRLGMTPQGAVVVAWRPPGGGVAVVTRSPLGAWSAPALAAPASRAVLDLALGVGPGGRVALVWLEARNGARVVAASTLRGGRWAPPTDLSAAGRLANDPAVAVGPDGDAVAAWRMEFAGHGHRIEIAEATAAGDWSSRRPAGPDAGTPRGVMRPPGPFLTSTSVAVGGGGDAAVAWAERGDGHDRAMVARRRDGRWTPPVALSGHGDSGWPQVAVDGAGRMLAVWEQLDGVRLNLRSATVPATGAPVCCRRLTEDGDEPAAPRAAPLASGALVVWNGSDDGTVETAEAAPCG